MARVYIGIGSNIDKHIHIPRVIKELRAKFGNVIISPIYKTAAVGFSGEDFFNLVVGIDTEMNPVEVFEYLRELETAHDRRRTSGNQFIARTLDLDQLLYDDKQIEYGKISIPHDDIINYPFVLKPLADIAGDLVHPELQVSIKSLWENFDKQVGDMQKLSLADIDLPDVVNSAN